jgi:hypothetical protein
LLPIGRLATHIKVDVLAPDRSKFCLVEICAEAGSYHKILKDLCHVVNIFTHREKP